MIQAKLKQEHITGVIYDDSEHDTQRIMIAKSVDQSSFSAGSDINEDPFGSITLDGKAGLIANEQTPTGICSKNFYFEDEIYNCGLNYKPYPKIYFEGENPQNACWVFKSEVIDHLETEYNLVLTDVDDGDPNLPLENLRFIIDDNNDQLYKIVNGKLINVSNSVEKTFNHNGLLTKNLTKFYIPVKLKYGYKGADESILPITVGGQYNEILYHPTTISSSYNDNTYLYAQVYPADKVTYSPTYELAELNEIYYFTHDGDQEKVSSPNLSYDNNEWVGEREDITINIPSNPSISSTDLYLGKIHSNYELEIKTSDLGEKIELNEDGTDSFPIGYNLTHLKENNLTFNDKTLSVKIGSKEKTNITIPSINVNIKQPSEYKSDIIRITGYDDYNTPITESEINTKSIIEIAYNGRNSTNSDNSGNINPITEILVYPNPNENFIDDKFTMQEEPVEETNALKGLVTSSSTKGGDDAYQTLSLSIPTKISSDMYENLKGKESENISYFIKANEKNLLTLKILYISVDYSKGLVMFTTPYNDGYNELIIRRSYENAGNVEILGDVKSLISTNNENGTITFSVSIYSLFDKGGEFITESFNTTLYLSNGNKEKQLYPNVQFVDVDGLVKDRFSKNQEINLTNEITFTSETQMGNIFLQLPKGVDNTNGNLKVFYKYPKIEITDSVIDGDLMKGEAESFIEGVSGTPLQNYRIKIENITLPKLLDVDVPLYIEYELNGSKYNNGDGISISSIIEQWNNNTTSDILLELVEE